MQRHRVQSDLSSVDVKHTRNATTLFKLHVPPDTISVGPTLVEDANGLTQFNTSGTIDDWTRPHGKKISRFRPWINPIQECTHVKQTSKYLDGSLAITYTVENDAISSQSVETYDSALAYAVLDGGYSPLTSPITKTSMFLNSLGTYQDVNWVTLLDSFGEACDSLVPQAFFFGEDAVESDIFIDAFKLVLNPSKIFKTASLLSRRLGRKGFKALTLGNAKHALKHAANGKLLYQFAVKPAIDDIRATLDAHRVVSERIKFLADHRGGFVPIKVTRKFTTDLDDPDDPPVIDGSTQLYAKWTEQYVRGSVSAWGKVRSDITVQPRWAAYIEYFGLNKIIGTAWELIPFSFVIDWISNAQESVNSLTRLRVSDPYTEIRNICYSQKKTGRGKFFALPRRLNGIRHLPEDLKPIPFCEFTSSDYRRTIAPPGALNFAVWKGIGLNKSLSLGALLLQRAL